MKIFRPKKNVYIYEDQLKKNWTKKKQRYHFYKENLRNNAIISNINGVTWNTREGHIIHVTFAKNIYISNQYKLRSLYSLLLTFFIRGKFGEYKDLAKKAFGWKINWIVKCGNLSCGIGMIRRSKRNEMMQQKNLDQCLYYIKLHNQQVWQQISNTKVKRFHCDCTGRNRSKFSVCNNKSCAKRCWKRHRNQCLSARI